MAATTKTVRGADSQTRAVAVTFPSDLAREVYSILGLPIDAIDIQSALGRIETAARGSHPFLVSTPNVNFLIICQRDRSFWESLLLSDLCPPDGMLIVWLARLVGVPLRARVAGSDIFEFLKTKRTAIGTLKIFLFGGSEGVAALASRSLNNDFKGMRCVGSIYPGYGAVEELSRDEYIDQINASGAHFLVASLGAQKGQAWLQRNHNRILVPVRSHLGATINFEAGTIRRAPAIFQHLGAEWLWRIKEEPYLWKRYFHDGKALLHLLWTRVLPLAFEHRRTRLLHLWNSRDMVIKHSETLEFLTLCISGDAVIDHVEKAKNYLKAALASCKPVKVDLSHTRVIDARQIGLLLMLSKCLKRQGLSLQIVGASARVRRIILLNGLGFLFTGDTDVAV